MPALSFLSRASSRPISPPYALAVRGLGILGAALLLSACSTVEPPVLPANLEAAVSTPFLHQDGWLATANQAIPTDTNRMHWWELYGDEALNQLMHAINKNNPTLEQAQARWREAQANIANMRAIDSPQIAANAAATRAGTSTSATSNQLRTGLTINWLPDLWGRNALRVQAAQASAQAAHADVAAARLALQLSTAENYVQLRTLELQRTLLQETQQAYQRALELTTNQYESGFVARADVIQAQSQLQSVRTQLTSNERQYALTRNAIAALTGQVPATLNLPASHWQALPEPPAQPAQLPSALLLQRPDVAAAQHLLTAAHARMGVAQKAWLPDLNLNASAALQAASWSEFINAPLRIWSLGPALAASVLDGGARQAEQAQVQAQIDGQAAAWRGQVLQAIKEVEDALATSAWLLQQHEQQTEMVKLAQENLRVMQNQYQSGLVSYLDVALVQNQELTNRRNLLDVQAQRLQANMQLFAALGGNWNAPDATTLLAP
ncbi:efflux transporter outer membrane subunit [Lampropedia puyangensis]|uniref:Efflux transporter outer membrane subunit n=1 Tax=Lampropedia puyangensis TaxID=1330072 RepID=A0A4S8FDE3_9BURK|nr:efflux transporter outer membrane subunit [Lampropedia puyangensis]THU05015.1 efflux transporter outer membrane subunit [Lampropedia puyangensis]